MEEEEEEEEEVEAHQEHGKLLARRSQRFIVSIFGFTVVCILTAFFYATLELMRFLLSVF